MSSGKLPHLVDRHVGSQIRLARRLARVAQMDLALRIGVTFQQVQKYESGANRISASKLYATALALGRGIGWFYEGLDHTSPPGLAVGACAMNEPALHKTHGFLQTREGTLIAAAMSSLSVERRAAVLDLVKALAISDRREREREREAGPSDQSAGLARAASRLGSRVAEART